MEQAQPLHFVPFARRAPAATLLQRLGEAMQRRRNLIQGIQWTVVLVYLALVTIPAFLPPPSESAHLYDNLALAAQFAFWGLWWPFVILSTMLLGRVWCGVFCPEGTLTEFASRHGRGGPIPRWLRWGGWPFVAFVLTTVYGQLVSVYQYPQAALLVLGGSTVAAVVVGYLYGRGKRVWCRYLCPVNGVFALLARLAPVHFRVDQDAWRQAPRSTAAVDCAPLINIARMDSAAQCHACGRCAGHRQAVQLAPRSPNREVLGLAPTDVSRPEALLLVFGLLGVAVGAFQWSASPWYVAMKQACATWLIERDSLWLLGDEAPWWLLTHYPAANDVFTWLDGLCILLYIGATTAVLGGTLLAGLYTAQTVLGRPGFAWRLSYALIPLGGLSVFLGLSMLTASLLRMEGLAPSWLDAARALLLALGAGWSAWLAWRLIEPQAVTFGRRLVAWGSAMAGVGAVVYAWVLLFFLW